MEQFSTPTLSNRAVIWAISLLTVFLAFSADDSPLLSAGLALILAVVILVSWWSRDQKLAKPHYLLFCLATIVAVLPIEQRDMARVFEGKIRIWNVYHYYMGSKYFAELGYTDLYVATLRADREGANYWTGVVTTTRDLKTYDHVDVEGALANYDPTDKFSPERWEEFKADVAALAPQRSAKGWTGILSDRGYNPPPVWTAVGGIFSQNIGTSTPGLLTIASLDLLLFFAMGFALYRAFGAGPAFLVLVLFVAAPMSVNRLTAGFLQYDWLASLVIGACLLKKERFVWAGLILSYALMTRVFPLFMIAGVFIPVVAHIISNRKIPSYGLRFFIGVTVGSIALFVLSIIPSHGIDGWLEFIPNIITHSGDHVFSSRRLGLEHAFTAGPEWFGERVGRSDREVFLEQRAPLYWLTSAVLIVTYVAVAWRSKPVEAFLMGLVVVFGLLVLSRYYYGVLALVPLVARGHRQTLLFTALQLLIFTIGFSLLAYGVSPRMHYVALNVGLAMYFTFVLVAKLFARADANLEPLTLRQSEKV